MGGTKDPRTTDPSRGQPARASPRRPGSLAPSTQGAVCRRHDVGTSGRQFWIALEFIEGLTLSD